MKKSEEIRQKIQELEQQAEQARKEELSEAIAKIRQIMSDNGITIADLDGRRSGRKGGGSTGEVDPFIWEAYYAFKPNDSMEVRPAIFGGSDVLADTNDDIFGALVTTTFKF